MTKFEQQNQDYKKFISWFKKFKPVHLRACLANHDRKEVLFNKFAR